LDPKDAKAHYNLAAVLADMDRGDEAIAEYREAVRLNEDYPEAHNNLGIELAKNGLFAEALVHFRRTEKLSSKIPGWP
jgi:Flp pilus assembly protein TadD